MVLKRFRFDIYQFPFKGRCEMQVDKNFLQHFLKFNNAFCIEPRSLDRQTHTLTARPTIQLQHPKPLLSNCWGKVIIDFLSLLNFGVINDLVAKMSTQLIPITPPVTWAQTTDSVFLTFNVESEKPEIIIERRAVTFEGVAKSDKKYYAVVIALYTDIDPKRSSYTNKGRYVEVFLTKDRANEPFWPALTSDRKKHHWLKIDFERWQEDNESDDLEENMDV